MFPIKHTSSVSDKGFKSITNIELIKNDKNTRAIEMDYSENDDMPIHSFYAHSQDFGDDQDSYI